MKTLTLLLLGISFNLMATTNNAYAFVTNFKLLSAEVEANQIRITLSHPRTNGEATFHFSPSFACMESFPPQCAGTVIRLDQGEDLGKWTTSEMTIRPEEIYPYPAPITIQIKGPNKDITVRY